ncbi:MAG: RnfABCDGE type electron transport complex subunit G [Candidatus Omnitrophica bacterium]|nr:RnfABCDGE type electron transport complex subunit G [Candidatus Omnitrophota bacterium]
MKETFRFGLILGGICFIATSVLSTVYVFTKTNIALQNQKALQQGLKEVLNQANTFEPVYSNQQLLYYKGLDRNKRLVGVAFVTRERGYAGEIETLVGMTTDGSITAIKILKQEETPGLGSRICEVRDDTTILDFLKGKRIKNKPKPWFTERFVNRKVSELKDIQAISGATVSSRAVIESVKRKSEEILKLLSNEK